MAHYAYVNPYTNQVEKIIVIEKKQVNSGLFGDPKNFVECSYNQRIGKVFPGIGYYYIEKSFNSKIKHRKVFIPPRPYMSWKFSEEMWCWIPPVPKPDDGIDYVWNERTKNWIQSIKTINILPKPDKSFVLNENYQWEERKSFYKRKIKNNKIVKFFKKLLF